MTVTTFIVEGIGSYHFTLLWSCDNRVHKNEQTQKRTVTINKRVDGNQFKENIFKNSDEVLKQVHDGAKVLLFQVISAISNNRRLERVSRQVSNLISRVSSSKDSFDEKSEVEWEFKVGPGVYVDFYSIGFQIPGIVAENLAFVQMSGGTKVSSLCNIPLQFKVTLKSAPPLCLKPYSFIHRSVNGVVPFNAIRLTRGFFFTIARTSFGDIPCKSQGDYAWYTINGTEFRTNHYYFIVPSPGYSMSLVETNDDEIIPSGVIKLTYRHECEESGDYSQYVCVVHIEEEGGRGRVNIPGRTDSQHAWCSYNEQEICTTNFSYVVITADDNFNDEYDY